MEDLAVTTGRRFYVSSASATASNAGGYGADPDKPVSTLDYAIGLCTENEGDIIYLMPGHAENVASAGAISIDKEGIKIVGLGEGDNKPTFTFITATTADIDIDADNVTIENVRFVCDIDALAAPIDVNNAYCTIRNCEFIDDGTDNTIDWIDLVAGSADFTIEDCINKGTATAGNDSFITMAATPNVTIRRCRSYGDFAAANVELTAAATELLIEDCSFENLNAVDVNIEGFAAATGWIRYNSLRIATDGQDTWINTPGATSLFENYGVNNDGETGMLVGTVSTS